MKKLYYLFLFILIAACSSEDDGASEPKEPQEEKNPVAVADEIAASENEELTFNRALLR